MERRGRKKRFNSLTFFILRNVISILIAILIFLVFIDIYSIRIAKDQNIALVRNTISLYASQLNSSLEKSSLDIVNSYTKCDLAALNHRPESKEKRIQEEYLIYATQRELLVNNKLLYYTGAYSPASGRMVSSMYTYTKENTPISNYLTAYLDSLYTSGEQMPRVWLPVSIENHYFLMRLMNISSVYIVSLIETDTLISREATGQFELIDDVFFVSPDGEVLTNNYETLIDAIDFDQVNTKSYSLRLNGSTYTAVGSLLNSCDTALFALMSKAASSGIYNVLLLIIVVISLTFIAIIPYQIWFLQRKVLSPIKEISGAMTDVGQGKLNIRMSTVSKIEEFNVMEHTFNSMVREISQLKISVYEEKLKKQNAEIQFLQTQSQPHFYSNALNTISNLAQVGKIDTIKIICRSLSELFRISMRQTSKLIPLSQELKLVENYSNIQKIRYDGDFIFNITSDPKLDTIKVPPLIIQTFIENAIKYSHLDEQAIIISAAVQKAAEEDAITIDVSDTGPGFDESILQRLQRREPIINEAGQHIGIQNLCSRLELIYGDRASIDFFNTDSGAHIHIKLPLTAEECQT